MLSALCLCERRLSELHGSRPLFQRLSPESSSVSCFLKRQNSLEPVKGGRLVQACWETLPERGLAEAAISRVHQTDIQGVSDRISTSFSFFQACRDGKPELFLLQ